MTSVRSKILEFFGNIKSDAVPRPPRPQTQGNNEEVFEAHNENVNTQNENTNGEQEEEIVIEPDNIKGKKQKPKKPFFKSKKKPRSSYEEPDTEDRRNSNSSVNTQATGNVFNIVNSKDVRCGNDYIYYMGPTKGHQSQSPTNFEDEHIEKCNLITLVMEAKIKPDHEYIDHISKNLGRNWHAIFRALGYSKGRIETVEMEQGNNVTEARYKLLLDWIRNEDDNSLGRLTTVLWDEGERAVVKELAIIYKKNKK